MYNIADRVKNFKMVFPALSEAIARNEITVTNAHMLKSSAADLTDENKKVISELDAKGFDVYAVIDTVSDIAGEDVKMTAYLLLYKVGHEDFDEIDSFVTIEMCNPPYAYALAHVINKSWNFAEMGDVVIGELDDGTLVRIG